MIVMGELRKLVLEGGSLVVVEPLEIGDILGGEMLLVEGWVGHAGLASCVSAGRRYRGRQRGRGRRGTEKTTGEDGSGTEGKARK